MLISGYDVMNDLDAARKDFLGTYGDWKEEYRDLILEADEHSARNMYQLPVGHRWEGKAGITLIGDAAHVMAPTSGEGVNIGMLDALNLSKAIVAARDVGEKGALAEKVRVYEEAMFVKADELKRTTRMNWEDMFHRDAPGVLIEGFVRRQGLAAVKQETASDTHQAHQRKL